MVLPLGKLEILQPRRYEIYIDWLDFLRMQCQVRKSNYIPNLLWWHNILVGDCIHHPPPNLFWRVKTPGAKPCLGWCFLRFSPCPKNQLLDLSRAWKKTGDPSQNTAKKTVKPLHFGDHCLSLGSYHFFPSLTQNYWTSPKFLPPRDLVTIVCFHSVWARQATTIPPP